MFNAHYFVVTATRRLAAKEKENNENEMAQEEALTGRPRCTRSASDPVALVVKSQVVPPPSRATRISSERSKSCDERTPAPNADSSSKPLRSKAAESLVENHVSPETE